MKFKVGDKVQLPNCGSGHIIAEAYKIEYNNGAVRAFHEAAFVDRFAELVPAEPKFKVGDLLLAPNLHVYQVTKVVTDRAIAAYKLDCVTNKTIDTLWESFERGIDAFTKIGVAV
jgi:hypothetical protein